MNRKVLVLNRSWQAIGVITLEKALQKVFSTYVDGTPKARIIDCVHDFKLMSWEDWSKVKPAEDEEGIRTPNSIFRIPEIIIYTRYDKLPQQKVHYNRRQIYHRDANRCQYCGFRKPNNELSLDHVVPKCLGGSNDTSNLVSLTYREHFICHKLLCKMINNKKHLFPLQYCYVMSQQYYNLKKQKQHPR